MPTPTMSAHADDVDEMMVDDATDVYNSDQLKMTFAANHNGAKMSALVAKERVVCNGGVEDDGDNGSGDGGDGGDDVDDDGRGQHKSANSNTVKLDVFK